jgi:hypothetical protein
MMIAACVHMAAPTQLLTAEHAAAAAAATFELLQLVLAAARVSLQSAAAAAVCGCAASPLQEQWESQEAS